MLEAAVAPAPPAPPAAAAAAAAVQPKAAASDGRGALLAALADALAGALGSVVAVAVFYPIDIAKTRAQASLSSLPSSPLSNPHDHSAKSNSSGSSTGGAFAGTEGLPVGRGVGTPGSSGGRRWFRSRTLAALVSIVRKEGGLTRLYEGIEAKALQALVGSFVYFYAYAFIKGAMRRRTALGASGGTGAGMGTPKPLRPSLNLLAAAMAGAVNQAFTLPLENITTRMQTGPQHARPPPPPPPPNPRAAAEDDDGRARVDVELRRTGVEVVRGERDPSGRRSDGSCGGDALQRPAVVGARGDGSGGGDGGSEAERTWRDAARGARAEGETEGETVRPGREGGSENQDRSGDSDKDCSGSSEPGLGTRGRCRPRQSVWTVTGDLYRESGGIGRFWRGFVPSLILTCNPAINYTAFDMLKALWLRRRHPDPPAAAAGASAGAAASVRGGGTSGFLNPLEAFLVAAAAKSLATLITYPLIRAKVVLMTSPLSTPIVDGADDDGGGNVGNARPLSLETARQRRRESKEGAPGGNRGGGVIGRSATTTTKTDKTASGMGSVAAADVGVREVAANEVLPPVHGDGVDAASSVREMPQPGGSAGAAGRGAGTPAAATAVREARGGDTRGIGEVMLDILRREGLGGLYAGCGAQLLHTILKSALLLATKEQIARAAASAVFLGGGSRGGGVTAVSAKRPQVAAK